MAVHKFSCEIPGTDIRYDKLYMVPTLSGGSITAMLAAVKGELGDGTPFEFERTLDADELEEVQKRFGIQQVCLRLAKEAVGFVEPPAEVLEELERMEGVRRATEAATAGAYEPYKEPTPFAYEDSPAEPAESPVVAPEPSTEDINYVLEGLETDGSK